MTQDNLFDFSRQAREQAETATAIVRADREALVLQALEEHFSDGATAYELAQQLKLDITKVRPRLTELAKAGILEVIGRRVNANFSPIACSVYKIKSKEGNELG